LLLLQLSIFFDQAIINHSMTAPVSKHPSMSRQVPELKSWLPTHWCWKQPPEKFRGDGLLSHLSKHF